MAAGLLLAGCGSKSTGGGLLGRATMTPSPTPVAKATITTTATPKPTATPRKVGPPPVPARYLAAARRLPIGRRVAQLMLVGFEGTDLQAPVFGELAGHGWGGIIVGPDNVFDLAGVGLLAGEARVRAQDAGTPPPLVASVDDGRPERLGSSRREARVNAKSAALAAKAQGVTLTTAPFIDVGLEADSKLIARVAPGAIQGWLAGGVAPAPGHFPGQGAVTQDPLDGPANVGTAAGQLVERDVRPFETALKRAPAVTISSATFTAYDAVTPAALTPTVVRDLLRGGLRFGGVAMSDDLQTLAVQTGGTQAQAAVDAIKAGIDLVSVPDASQRTTVFVALKRAAKRGAIPRQRVLTAAARVLQLKARVR